MKKRIISLITTGVIITSAAMLSACGGKTTQSTTADTSVSDNSADDTSGSTTLDPVTIKFSSTFQESETGGKILQYFIDTVSKLSEDAVTVDMSWGATLFTSADELDAVMDGSVNMIALGHMPHLNTLTYLSFPAFAPGSTTIALNYFQTLIFDDPDTSALIQSEAEALGIKYLNVIAGGTNAFCSNNKFTDLDSLIAGSSAFGNMDAAVFEKLGFQVTSLLPPDTYDALNRGLVDSTQMALSPMVAMSWYEPSKYWALDGTYTAGNFFTVNLDWWESLSDAQRIVIEQAAKETQKYTNTLYDDAIRTDITTVEEKTGEKFVTFSDGDISRIWAATFEAKASSAMELAETAGKTEGMIKILEKAAELTNYEWEH